MKCELGLESCISTQNTPWRYPGVRKVWPMQLLNRSLWSHVIAPRRCGLSIYVEKQLPAHEDKRRVVAVRGVQLRLTVHHIL